MGLPFVITPNSIEYYGFPESYKKSKAKIVFVNGQRKVVISQEAANELLGIKSADRHCEEVEAVSNILVLDYSVEGVQKDVTGTHIEL